MTRMQLSFFCEESGISLSDIARMVGCSRQKVWYWANCRETWVHCSDDFVIDRIESVNTKTVGRGKKKPPLLGAKKANNKSKQNGAVMSDGLPWFRVYTNIIR